MPIRRLSGRARAAVLAAATISSTICTSAGLSAVSATPAAADSATPSSFWLATPSGDVWNFGKAGSYGSAGNLQLTHPVVGITPTPDRAGYWLVANDGGIFSFGDAGFHGSTGNLRLNRPIVGMAATSDGAGYWLVANDGGVFTFGDARFYGSTGSLRLAQPIVGMVATPDNHGYWLFASDGGIFSFGDARFFGSTGAIRLAQPVVAMAATPDGGGYLMLAGDGGVFNFGDAAFHGSMGGSPSPEPAERIVSTRTGAGYWIVDQNGTPYPFGDATGAPSAQGLMFSPVTAGDRAVLFAFSQLGKPYIWGGTGPAGYDCSGLVYRSWQVAADKTLPRIADDQYHSGGPPVPMNQLVAGDLVFWGSSPTDWTTVYHAAMYVGGDRIVESTGDHVQLNSLTQWGTGDIMPNGVRPQT